MKSIAIQQTLHGYSEGHRLLDGSIKLNDELGRIVLRMSDLSGSNVTPGFEEYLTGYPLEAANLYAFAKTWYATEMPRPGCVWTHTLYIPGDCIGEIPDLQTLNALFLRPQNTKNFTGYSKAIQFGADRVANAFLETKEPTSIQVADLIETLYRQNKDNVLIGAQSSRTYEVALFRLWSQQWPLLRKTFTFCTGGLSARGFGGKPFDVQCSPNSLLREITASSVSKQSQEMTLLLKAGEEQPSWFVTATEDALNVMGGTFRQLLWAFADVSSRYSYEVFAQLINRVLNSSDCSLEEIVDLVAEKFPNKETGYALKSAFFGTERSIPGFQPFDEGKILAALAITTHSEAFDSEALMLKSRAAELCSRDVASARQTISSLFRSPVNSLGEDILAGMIGAINPDIAKAVTSEQPQFLPTLFRAKPELGMSSELWMAAGDRKRELFEALASQPTLNEDLIRGIGVALVESDSDFLLKRALEKWGQPIVFGIFDCLARGSASLSERSIGALTFHVESIVKWVLAHENAPQSAVIVAAHIIAPYTYQFSQFDSSVWLKTFQDLVKHGDQREANYFAAMILALGFQNAPPKSMALVEESFERIHRVAWDDAMPNETWYILDPVVPHLWWHRDWDKCERLRRGLIHAFVKFHWPIVQLTDFVKDDEVLSRVIESAKHVDGGKELISQKF